MDRLLAQRLFANVGAVVVGAIVTVGLATSASAASMTTTSGPLSFGLNNEVGIISVGGFDPIFGTLTSMTIAVFGSEQLYRFGDQHLRWRTSVLRRFWLGCSFGHDRGAIELLIPATPDCARGE